MGNRKNQHLVECGGCFGTINVLNESHEYTRRIEFYRDENGKLQRDRVDSYVCGHCLGLDEEEEDIDVDELMNQPNPAYHPPNSERIRKSEGD